MGCTEPLMVVTESFEIFLAIRFAGPFCARVVEAETSRVTATGSTRMRLRKFVGIVL